MSLYDDRLFFFHAGCTVFFDDDVAKRILYIKQISFLCEVCQIIADLLRIARSPRDLIYFFKKRKDAFRF